MKNMTNNDLVNKIRKDLIDTTYYSEIKSSLRGSVLWKNIGDICQTISKVFAGISTVCAFAAGFFNLVILSFLAGCLGTLSMVTQQFSSYASNESIIQIERTNKILKDLGIANVVDIETGILRTNNNVPTAAPKVTEI